MCIRDRARMEPTAKRSEMRHTEHFSGVVTERRAPVNSLNSGQLTPGPHSVCRARLQTLHSVRDNCRARCLSLNSTGAVSSQHPRGHTLLHARHPREDATMMSRVSGDLPVQLATRLPDCSAARLSVCRVVLQIPRARHARLVADS